MRGRIPLLVTDDALNPTAGAEVTIVDRDSGELATIYVAETGGGTIANPTTSDTRGRVVGWLDRGGYEATIVGAGDPTLEPFEVATARDGGVDLEWIADAIAPIGVPLPLTTPTVPDGFALADGSEVAIADAPRLAAALADTWGAAAAGNFKLPDLRGRTLVGADHGAGRIPGLAIGDTVGVAEVTLTLAELPQHAHTLGNPAEIDDIAVVPAVRDSVGGDWTNAGDTASGGADFVPRHSGGVGAGALDNIRTTGSMRNPDTTVPAATGQSHDNVQPSAAVDWILRLA